MISYYFHTIPILLCVLSISTTMLLFSNSKLNSQIIVWGIMNLATAVWFSCFYVVIHTPVKDIALQARSIMDLSAILAICLWYYAIIQHTYQRRYSATNVIILSYACLLVYLNFTKYFIKDLVPIGDFNFYVVAGFGYYMFMIFTFLCLVKGSSILISGIIRTREIIDRRLLIIILISSFFGFSGLGSAFFLTIGINIKPFAIILFSLFFLLTTYAIYKHELLRARVYFLQVFVSVTWIIIALMAIAKWHETGATVASVTSISLLSLSFFTLFMVKKEMDMDRDLDRTERLLVAQLPESIRIMFARNVKERFDIYFEREIMLNYFENLTKNFHNSRRV
jgi:hypothetical protein